MFFMYWNGRHWICPASELCRGYFYRRCVLELIRQKNLKSIKAQSRELEKSVCAMYCIDEISKKSRRPIQAEARQVLLYILRKRGFKNHHIGLVYGVDHSTVSYSVKRIQGFIDSYPEYQKIKDLI